jgi:SAM-dependent methyltransferase
MTAGSTQSSGIIGWLHDRYVVGQRVQRLCDRLVPLIPESALLLDVGCGDGMLARRILAIRPDVTVDGLDVLIRPTTAIRVRPFDGTHLPCADASVDTVMFVDVLHHAADPVALLREARRVSRHDVLIKDHTRDGWLAQRTLRLMDWVGNARHGVALPYTYWSRKEWEQVLESVGLGPDVWLSRLDLYPAPGSWLFERQLHFVARLKVTR